MTNILLFLIPIPLSQRYHDIQVIITKNLIKLKNSHNSMASTILPSLFKLLQYSYSLYKINKIIDQLYFAYTR